MRRGSIACDSSAMTDSAFWFAYVIVAAAVAVVWVRQMRNEYRKLATAGEPGVARDWLRRARLASLVTQALLFPMALSASGAFLLVGKSLALQILLGGGVVLAVVSIIGGICHGVYDHKSRTRDA